MLKMSQGANGESNRESEPLLNGYSSFGSEYLDSRRPSSGLPSIARLRSGTITSIRSTYETVKEHMDKKKFAYLVLASLFLYLGFVGAFAPRTSLARDLRRIHASRLTDAEVYRIYLNALYSENHAGEHLKNYTSQLHGTGDAHVLDYTVSELRKLGFDPKLERFYPWVSEPVDTQVALYVDDTITFNATLKEECVAEDPSSCNLIEKRAYHGYSASGNVTSQYIFANYGSLEDYTFLLDNGVDIDGKVHVIRYGRLLPGLKVKNAELFGASGVLMYTDPYDDGRITKKNGFKMYPAGPARHESSIERGSVAFMNYFPGDPTTPGYPSKFPGTERLSPAGKVPTIPSIPVSAKEIAPILQLLNGKGVRLGSGGNIDGFEYFSGPSDLNEQVKLYNQQHNSIIEITNVIVEISGIFSEYDILIGNHRDSWTAGGAGSPNSGSAVLLEIARGMSELLKHGWKPLRPVKLISWDGGELSMLGSSEYVENHAEILKRSALVYLNLESAITGSQFSCKSNPLLEDVIRNAAKYTDLGDGDEGTLYDEWKRATNLTNDHLDGIADYVPFQYHLGIPSASFEFSNNKTCDAVVPYHSIYDTYTWMEKFVDKDYRHHNTLAVLTGMTSLMLCEREPTVFKVHPYFKDINKWYQKWHQEVLSLFPSDRELRETAQTVADNLQGVTFNETILFDTQNIELNDLCTRDFATYEFYKKIRIYLQLMRANNKLKQIDQMFLTHRGLLERPWMKHSIYAPDKLTGYDVDVLPGLHEALLDHDRDGVLQWLSILLTQISNVKSLLQ